MPNLSFFSIGGSPLEAGRALGRFGAEAVHRHLVHSKAWATVMAWRGSEQALAMSALVQARFPGVWLELQGLAEGLQLPAEDVFLWNCRGDVWAMAPDGCTTVQVPGLEQRRIAHNEDGDPGFAGHCAMADCAIAGSPRFVSFVYPGSLPGHTFAVTQSGLAMSVNNLRELHVDPGLPRMVLTRAVLNAGTVDQAVAVLREQPRAGGFHVTLGHKASSELLSVEFCSQACSVQRIAVPSLHANHAIHPDMREFAQLITASSAQRQIRGGTLLAGADGRNETVDALSVLADTENAMLPIYRSDPNDSDDENTMATVEMSISASRIDWRVYEHPKKPARYTFVDVELHR